MSTFVVEVLRAFVECAQDDKLLEFEPSGEPNVQPKNKSSVGDGRVRREIVPRCAKRGAAEADRKSPFAARTEESWRARSVRIRCGGGEALAVKMDVADAEQVKAALAVLEKFGTGHFGEQRGDYAATALSMRMKLGRWEACVEANLTGAHLLYAAGAGLMMRARRANH